MEKSTQTNRTDIEYVSIYEQRPKKQRGRPKGCKYTDEEKAERARLSTMKYYYNNLEKERERSRINKAKKKNI
tara:strand:- start:607 stop:825 length:219 start_codon:yes stop_codon:yes gene_type:complete